MLPQTQKSHLQTTLYHPFVTVLITTRTPNGGEKMDNDFPVECCRDGYSPCKGEVVVRAMAVAYEIPAFCEKHWAEISRGR